MRLLGEAEKRGTCVQRVSTHVIPPRHRLISQIVVWIERIKLLRMTGVERLRASHVCSCRRPQDACTLHHSQGWIPHHLVRNVGQYGTHVDPPAHFAENGITMDQIPLKQMILPLVVLDDTPYLAKDPNHAFSVADLKAWERKHGRVPRGAFAALRTDMSKDWQANPERFKRSPFPAWAFETIKFLYEQRGVTATGHEALDTDTTEKMDAETYILQHGHYQIEVMANLDKVPATGALIVVSWPKVENGLGFPARAFAILP
jgi:kynurenine formamidase